jgi:hypothetical protein
LVRKLGLFNPLSVQHPLSLRFKELGQINMGSRKNRELPTPILQGGAQKAGYQQGKGIGAILVHAVNVPPPAFLVLLEVRGKA